MRVFVSYASEDRPLAEEVALALTGAGHEVFFDRSSLPAGGDFHSRILAAVNGADLLIFLASPASLATGAYTLTELKFARDRWPHPKDRVLTVRLPGVAFDAMPAYLKSVTVLEPEGNTAAEVLAAVQALAAAAPPRRARLRMLAVGGGAAVVAGVATWALWPSRGPAPAPASSPTSSAAPAPAPQVAAAPSASGPSMPTPAKPVPKPAPPVSTKPPAQPPAAAPVPPAGADGLARAQWSRLQAVGITSSQPQRIVGWLALPDRRYERLADATLGLTQGRRLKASLDIDKVMYLYTTKYLKLPNAEDGLPQVPEINQRALRSALVDAYNDKNGTQLQRLEQLFQ